MRYAVRRHGSAMRHDTAGGLRDGLVLLFVVGRSPSFLSAAEYHFHGSARGADLMNDQKAIFECIRSLPARRVQLGGVDDKQAKGPHEIRINGYLISELRDILDARGISMSVEELSRVLARGTHGSR